MSMVLTKMLLVKLNMRKWPIVIPWEATIETWGKGFFNAAIYLNPPSAETG